MPQWNPLVSIVIPNFNRATLLPQTLDSLINQEYTNWEAIIVDDGSTDNSKSIIEYFVQKDSRVKFFVRTRQPKGAPTCRNLGVNHAAGDFIVFLDSDDLLASYCLKQRVDHFSENRQLDFCVFPGLIFYEKIGDSNILINKLNGEDDLLRFLNQDNPWLIFNPIWKRTSLLDYDLNWDETALSFQDYDFHINALIKGLLYNKVNARPDCFWRRHAGESISSSNNSIKRINSLFVIINKTYKALCNSNLMTKEYELSIGSSYLDLVHRSLAIKNYDLAKSIWEQAYNQGVIKKKIYLEGISYIQFRSIPFLNSFLLYNKLVMKLFYFYWGKNFFNKNYNTFLRTKYYDLKVN